MDKKLYFIRHPESEANRIDMQSGKHKVIASGPQVPPSVYGKQSTQTLSQSIKKIGVFNPSNTLLISGTQERAIYPARILANDHGFDLLIDKDYNERDFGIFGGITKEELIECILSMNIEGLSKDTPLSDILDYKNAMPGWFETNKEVQQRLQSALCRDIYTHPGYDYYIIITSTGIKRNALAIALNADKGSDVDVLLPHNTISNLSKTELYYALHDGSLYLGDPPVIAEQWI